MSRILLPGSGGPRLKGLNLSGLEGGYPPTAYAASATGAELVFATMRFAPITVAIPPSSNLSSSRLSILFRPHQIRTAFNRKKDLLSEGCLTVFPFADLPVRIWWSRRVLPPSPERVQ